MLDLALQRTTLPCTPYTTWDGRNTPDTSTSFLQAVKAEMVFFYPNQQSMTYDYTYIYISMYMKIKMELRENVLSIKFSMVKLNLNKKNKKYHTNLKKYHKLNVSQVLIPCEEGYLYKIPSLL